MLPTFHGMEDEAFSKRNTANLAKIASTQYSTFRINTKPYSVIYKGFHYLVSTYISTFISFFFFFLIFWTSATLDCFQALHQMQYLFLLCFCLETLTLPILSEVCFKFYFLRYNSCEQPSCFLVCCKWPPFVLLNDSMPFHSSNGCLFFYARC